MKRLVSFLAFLSAFSPAVMSQTAKLPLWAAFPEEDEYVGIAFPGGGEHQAELSALLNYCVIKGEYSQSRKVVISDRGAEASVKTEMDSDPLLTYELVRTQELPSGETVALVRVGGGREKAKCVVKLISDIHTEGDNSVKDIALQATFSSGPDKDMLHYQAGNNSFSYSFTSSDGREFKYDSSISNSHKAANDNSIAKEKALIEKLDQYLVGDNMEWSFPTRYGWSGALMEILTSSYPEYLNAYNHSRMQELNDDPELAAEYLTLRSYCSLALPSKYTVFKKSNFDNNIADSKSVTYSKPTGNRISALVSFSQNGGVFIVESSGGRISKEQVISDSRQEYESFIKEHLGPSLRKWQQKGEFERTSDWEKRVNSETMKRFADSLLTVANNKFIQRYSLELTPTLERYDADNEVFLINDAVYGDILMKVPYSKARNFKENWSRVHITPHWGVSSNGRFFPDKIDFALSKSEVYHYDRGEALSYNNAKTEERSLDYEALLRDSSPGPGRQTKTQTVLKAANSDVDTSIPAGDKVKDNTFAVIIGNENYQSEKAVDFASNDAAVFALYCRKTLGLPERNIHLVMDATLNNIAREVNWITAVAKQYDGDADLIFYYAGHGVPDVSTREAYLLPVDGYGHDTETGFSLSRLYKRLSEVPGRSTLVLLDACFSGADRSGEVMASNRGVALKPREAEPAGNIVVFSATCSDQVANPYSEKCHGLFTYYLLDYIKTHPQDLKVGDLADYVTEKVSRHSIVATSKPQTPTVSTARASWRDLKL